MRGASDSYFVKIIKFALPLAALICFSAAAPLAVGADSDKKRRTSATAKKKSSGSKAKSKSSKSAQAKKGKSKSSTRTAKKKTERRVAKTDTASQSWIDDLPEVELPTVDGPAEDELLEPVADTAIDADADGDTDVEADADPEP